MIMTDEMTDAEVADQIDRADRFIGRLREMIAETVVDPASLCADAQRRGLRQIADTLDAVPYVTFCNLANLDAALRGGLLDLVEVRLMCVGAGPTLDFADAAGFLAGLQKSFLADDRKFLGRLMRFVCGDVRDHIVSPKIDHEPSEWRYRVLRPIFDFCNSIGT